MGTQQNYKKAFEWCKKAADNRLPEAIYDIGTFYYSGIVVEKNLSEAFSYFKEAAELGVARAQNMVGAFYNEGLNGTKDYSQARLWFEMAAKQEEPMALYNLALFYDSGLGGLIRDCKEATRLLEKSANLGCYPAQMLLAEGYRKGLAGLPINSTKAKYWEQKAVNNKDKDVIMMKQ